MSDLLLSLFHSTMDTMPYTESSELDQAEAALEQYLGREGEPLLRAYENAWNDRDWEESRALFYKALALGIELGTLTPDAGACRRP